MSKSGCAMMRSRLCSGPCDTCLGPETDKGGVRRGGACRLLARTGACEGRPLWGSARRA